MRKYTIQTFSLGPALLRDSLRYPAAELSLLFCFRLTGRHDGPKPLSNFLIVRTKSIEYQFIRREVHLRIGRTLPPLDLSFNIIFKEI